MKKTFLKFLKYFGILIVLIILFIVFLFLYPTPKPLAQKNTNSNYILSNVHIVDAINDTILRDKAIQIRNNRILQIFSTDSIINTKDTIVNTNGKFVMAGLWNMHSHLALQTAPQTTMPLQIANGITYLRDMQGVVRINKERKKWIQQIKDRVLLGPRIIGYADEIVGDNYDERDVLKVVKRSKKNKNTFIKIYSNILEERYFKLAKAARKEGVTFAGHYPNAIDPLLASNAGQRSFEHAHLFIDYSQPRANELRKYYKARTLGIELDSTLFTSYEDRIATFKEHRFQQLITAMIRNKTYFCPTHVTKKYEANFNNPDFINDRRVKYIPSIIQTIWDGDIESMKKRDINTTINFYKRGLELTGLAHQKGVKILAGTDTYDPYSFPGFTIHSELEELVKAGLSPAEAIITATVNPAEYFSLLKDYGSIEEGKVADILLLEKNPLNNIKNSTSIQSVFYNGSLYSRKELDAMLTYVEENVSGISGLSLTVKVFFKLMKDNKPSARNSVEEEK